MLIPFLVTNILFLYKIKPIFLLDSNPIPVHLTVLFIWKKKKKRINKFGVWWTYIHLEYQAFWFLWHGIIPLLHPPLPFLSSLRSLFPETRKKDVDVKLRTLMRLLLQVKQVEFIHFYRHCHQLHFNLHLSHPLVLLSVFSFFDEFLYDWIHSVVELLIWNTVKLDKFIHLILCEILAFFFFFFWLRQADGFISLFFHKPTYFFFLCNCC